MTLPDLTRTIIWLVENVSGCLINVLPIDGAVPPEDAEEENDDR